MTRLLAAGLLLTACATQPTLEQSAPTPTDMTTYALHEQSSVHVGEDPHKFQPSHRPLLPHVSRATARPKTPRPVVTSPTPRATPKARPGGATVWDRLAACESTGRWDANTGNGYYGGLQFSLRSWRWVGGTGRPDQASRAEQIRRATILQHRQGWGAWPVCSRKVGLR